MLLKALKSNYIQFVYLSIGQDVLFLEEDSNVDVRQTVHLFALIAMKLVILLVTVLRRRVKRLLLKVHLLKWRKKLKRLLSRRKRESAVSVISLVILLVIVLRIYLEFIFLMIRKRRFIPPNVCYHCLQSGHLARDCKNEIVCSRCEQPGHKSRDCKNDPVCYKCKQSGHIASECTNPIVCYKCGQPGHKRSECQA